jgi:putative DNA primase/helicase
MNRRNAVVEWVNSKPWDGVRRVESVISSVECSGEMDNKLKETLMLKWMVSAWAATSRKDGDNFQTRGVIVFQGKQEIGKTNFLRTLCGRAYGGSDSWFGVGNTFNAESIDNIVRVNRYWICEFAELESTTRYSMGALKAFLTNPENVVRFKYAREETIIYSRTVYAGTVNQMAFLPDPTGNSRFWCIPVAKFNDISQIDMQQVWAEVKRYHDVCIQDKDKYIWWLSPEESAALEQSNNRHEAPSSASDLLGACLDWEAKENFWREATCTQLLVDCGIREDVTKSLVTQAGMYLQRMGLKQRNTGKLRLYFAPPRKPINTENVHGNQLKQESLFNRINS